MNNVKKVLEGGAFAALGMAAVYLTVGAVKELWKAAKEQGAQS